MGSSHDVALEFLRRTMAGQNSEELRQFVTQALIDGEGATGGDGWRIRTAEDALQPHAPIEYLVDGLLPAPSLSIVYGGPGSLKSMILADLCVCVAGGKRWLDNLPDERGAQNFTTKQAPTLWIDFDNGNRRTDIRFGALLRAHNLDANTPCHYVSMPTPHLDASKANHIEALARLIVGKGYKLVVIDNLGLVTGDTEENSADMANVMGNLRRLAEMTGCAIILIHHQRKSAANGDANGIRKGETLRGHSSIEAALDLALLVERRPGENSITIFPTKVRDFLDFAAVGAMFTYEHADGTRDLHSARFFAFASISKEEAAAAQLENTIKDTVRTNPGIDQKHLVDEVRDRMAILTGTKQPGINKTRGTLKQMADAGKITAKGDPQNGIRYFP